MDAVKYWIITEGHGHYFFVAFPVCMLVLLLLLKGKRLSFVIPSILITLLIVNPMFYRLWDGLGLYAYWRLLWVIPVIPITAAIVPVITMWFRKIPIKTIALVIGAGLIFFYGTYIYNGVGGYFQIPAENTAKLPKDVIAIADSLLSLLQTPRVILEYPLGVYVRQYSGEIQQLTGRDADGFIYSPSSEIWSLVSKVNKHSWGEVFQEMIDEDYDYIVHTETMDGELIDQIDNWKIYKPIGIRSIEKDKNELGQVVKTTNIDENGNPVSNREGVITVLYDYDYNGYPYREYYVDPDGVYLGKERIKSEELNTEQIFYLNKDGKRFMLDGGYYGYEQKYDVDNRLVERIYIDNLGNETQREDGYSRVNWIKDDQGSTSIRFLDALGEAVDVSGLNLADGIEYGTNGWSNWMIPKQKMENYYIRIGSVTLGEREAGDSYSCQLEIEFKDVTTMENGSFFFCTQGETDNKWEIRNIWNTGLIKLTEAPADGCYKYSNVIILDSDMAKANVFRIGFRCDNWNSGMFRVRNIKIEKGDNQTEWSPGL